MKFDETNKVIIETLNESEARAFIWFLRFEKLRHRLDIALIYLLARWGGDWHPSPHMWYIRLFFRSAIIRHERDIEDAQKLIKIVEAKKWN